MAIETNAPVCIRCGGCCKAIPCTFSQMWYGISESFQLLCPDLEKKRDGTFSCGMMATHSGAREAMLGTGCHYLEWRK